MGMSRELSEELLEAEEELLGAEKEELEDCCGDSLGEGSSTELSEELLEDEEEVAAEERGFFLVSAMSFVWDTGR